MIFTNYKSDKFYVNISKMIIYKKLNAVVINSLRCLIYNNRAFTKIALDHIVLYEYDIYNLP